jgi:hypothetical protein
VSQKHKIDGKMMGNGKYREDRKNGREEIFFIFSHLCLVGRIEKWNNEIDIIFL